MNGNGSGKSRIDEAYERGYAQGYRHGIGDRPKMGNWNLPEVKPNESEVVCAIVQPYDRKSARFCKKFGKPWFPITGVFMGRETVKKIARTDPDVDMDEIPDLLFIDKKEAIDWEYVLLWLSEEIPEWFLNKKEGTT